MKYTIKTPVRGYTGISASLHFLNGQAETDSDRLADWFKKHKYEVIVNEPAKPKTTRKKGGNSND